ncbi:helicase-related protein [Zophobihabitans entericus]|uniref:DEAD/DEAH box helicase n=1 Tax=Zophobihabitans entericus TaxID=1635327 RepID=A0A6G9IE24_9GAMM|nr:DEAD/DEAH box helicase [Zophobihabitans entericus]
MFAGTDDFEVIAEESDDTETDEAVFDPLTLSLSDFVSEFGDELLDKLNESNPPVYQGQIRPLRQAVLDGLNRQLFPAQANVAHAVMELLVNRDAPAAIVNGEMGCGKTTIGIAIAAMLHAEGFKRMLVLSPPHLVYKWRREILETIPNAKVWVLNGPDTLSKLIALRHKLRLGQQDNDAPEFYILGRVRMRMGFHWRPAFRRVKRKCGELASCPHCGTYIQDGENFVPPDVLINEEKRRKCVKCHSALWTLMRPKTLSGEDQKSAVLKSLKRIPTIGPATADKLINKFGEEFLASMLGDNIHNFINLMDGQGHLVFSDKQAARMEKALAKMEFGFGEGGYQPTEYIKRYLPKDTFQLMIADEAHEYKNLGSAQGQAMGVLASKVKKILLLTGTLMGGYADDIFYLLFRCLTNSMLEDGYKPKRGSLTSAGTAFMRDHGILKDVYSESKTEHKTASGSKMTVRTSKAPGFGPKGVMRSVIPYTVFLRLKQLGKVLPPYEEEFRHVYMSDAQASCYKELSGNLTYILRRALAKRDTTLLGLVLNILLRWPETCFKEEDIRHPRTRKILASTPEIFDPTDISPKEQELINICKAEKAAGRKVLAYSIYTGKHDTLTRLKTILEREGLKVGILRASVKAEDREDEIARLLERGIDVLLTNPDLVKTGMDLLEFQTIVFMQSGYNVYTLMQASRRSWRIGQTESIKVIFLGYAQTSQIACLELMAKKIAVAMSTSGEMPDSGLDVLNSDGDSVEIELARQLIAQQAAMKMAA